MPPCRHAAGLAATCYVICFMGLRCFGGLYAPGGRFFAQVPSQLAPSFGAAGLGEIGWGSLVLISLLATSYMAHYNAPKFLCEASGASVASDGLLVNVSDEGLQRFGRLYRLAFGAAAISFGCIAAFGFLTFGSASSGNVLTNYAKTDPLASAARIAVAVSIIAGYPLAFANLKDASCRACNAWSGDAGCPLPPRGISLLLLTMLTAAAAALTDLGLVSALAGAVLGSAIIYVYPSAMFRGAVRKKKLSIGT